MNALYEPQFQYLNFESVQNGLSDFNSEEQFRCFRYDLKISVSMIPGNIDNEKISAIRHTVLNDILVKNASDFFLYDGSIEKLTVDLVSLRLRSIECYWIVLGEPLENNASLINSYFEIFKSIVKSKGVIFCDKKFGNFYENVSYLIDLLWGMQPMMETPRTSFPKVHVRPTRVKNVVASEPSQPSEERFISVRTFQRRENDFVLEKRSFLIGIE